jgi:hypothetical protein
MTDAYRVEVDDHGCPGCGHGVTYTVMGPDGYTQGVSFGEESDAYELASALNGAFRNGRHVAFVTVGRRVGPEDRRDVESGSNPPAEGERRASKGRRLTDDDIPF